MEGKLKKYSRIVKNDATAKRPGQMKLLQAVLLVNN